MGVSSPTKRKEENIMFLLPTAELGSDGLAFGVTLLFLVWCLG